jgi:hypothetical protein
MRIRLKRGLGEIMTVTALLMAAIGRAAEFTNLPPVLPPPEFLDNKSPLPDLLLKDKRAGSISRGFPITFGTRVSLTMERRRFDNGPADSPFPLYAYRQRYIAAAGSTGVHRALIERPAL